MAQQAAGNGGKSELNPTVPPVQLRLSPSATVMQLLPNKLRGGGWTYKQTLKNLPVANPPRLGPHQHQSVILQHGYGHWLHCVSEGLLALHCAGRPAAPAQALLLEMMEIASHEGNRISLGQRGSLQLCRKARVREARVSSKVKSCSLLLRC